MKNKSLLAVITARAGSVRIKNKNIKKINNKPLIYYTLNEAKKNKSISKLIVSTDSKSIVNYSKKFGVEAPFIRPKNISGSNSASIDVLKHALKFYEKKGKKYDYLAILQPTSPLRKSKHITEAFNKLIKNNKANGIISVCKSNIKKECIGNLDNKLKLINFSKTKSSKKIFHLNGAIYIFKSYYLKGISKINYSDKIYAYVMPRKYSLDIDDNYDFKIAKILLRNNV